MTENPFKIPVFLTTPLYKPADPFIDGCPVIYVYATYDPDWVYGQSTEPPRHEKRSYAAMLDTGAQSIGIDARLAAELGAKPIRKGTAYGWVGTDNNVQIVSLQIIVPETGFVICGEASVHDFSGPHQQWDIILGRPFLRCCHLTVDGPRSKYLLELLPEGRADTGDTQ